ncbi:MAG TPA: tRNA (5-methylaminomethyl-2-thiouridine)(34)-methyltransferase MnmD [Ramlibacter sp.]|nr:tRNA (5-methylaminomethyl-2-thiouridine)(34)-methyltransferase MnmD [Ramlibacter sp.]
MPERVEWQPDGTPRSARFDDIYRSASGGLEQSRHVFLHGCDLPAAWAGRAQWRVLETGFGLGLNFLAVWRAWKDDPQRPHMLHFVSVEAWPVSSDDLVRSASAYGELLPLARELATQWFDMTPGVHRLSFEKGRVLLTLHVRDAREMLRSEPFTADSVFLDGFDPQRNPEIWHPHTMKAVARHCHRGTRLATWTAAGEVRRALQSCGFIVEKADGLPPKRHCTRAVFDPHWTPKGLRDERVTDAADAIVVGAGLAGAAVAASLARRGWRVTVVDAAQAPAAGASGLPVGLLAPHASPDDNLLSRLSRAGVRMTMQQARESLRGGEWRETGVMRIGHENEWHEHAGWIKPAALVQAWLAQPGIEWQGSTRVSSLESYRGKLVVVAAAHESGALLGDRLELHAVRGQIAWGSHAASLQAPTHAVNGNGHFIPRVPMGDGGPAWFCGSTYGRDDADASVRDEDTRANIDRLHSLLPDVASQVHAQPMRAWAGVRCTSRDRRPLVGEVESHLWVTTAMGSRGLTFCVLAAELIAARLHGEPLPVETRLASAIDAKR